MVQTNELTTIGLDAAIYWDSLTNLDIARPMGLMKCCPDFGTAICMTCAQADLKAREVCNFKCASCPDRTACACSLEGWQKRRDEDER